MISTNEHHVSDVLLHAISVESMRPKLSFEWVDLNGLSGVHVWSLCRIGGAENVDRNESKPAKKNGAGNTAILPRGRGRGRQVTGKKHHW
jgi:hypothetical protein